MALSTARKDLLQGGSGLAPGSGSPDLVTLLKERLLAAPTLTVGTEATNAIAVTVQLKNLLGANVAEKRVVTWWVSSTAGGTVAATAPTGGTAVTTGTTLVEITAEKIGLAMTDASGVLGLTLTDTGTPTFFVNVSVDGMGGQLVSSAAVTFA
jgi:hypothetical protein